jgi:predicted ATPase
MIIGEPGLGKSRLIEEFHVRLGDTPHTWVEWSCSQLLQNTPLHPIAEWGRQRFGGADVPAERRLADLKSSLQQVKLDPVENAPLLAPLVEPLRHRQTKGAETDMFDLQLPRHISTYMRTRLSRGSFAGV